MTDQLSRKLAVAEAAAYLSLSKSTLDKLRVAGGGPAYIRLGRRVVYDVSDLNAWAAQHRETSTSERKAA